MHKTKIVAYIAVIIMCISVILHSADLKTALNTIHPLMTAAIYAALPLVIITVGLISTFFIEPY